MVDALGAGKLRAACDGKLMMRTCLLLSSLSAIAGGAACDSDRTWTGVGLAFVALLSCVCALILWLSKPNGEATR